MNILPSPSSQGLATRADDVHLVGGGEVDDNLRGIPAALAHRIQQVHPPQETQG